MADDWRLVDAAMNLRGSAPEAWEGFVMAVRDYAMSATADMLKAETGLLARQQGVAVGLNHLASVLRDAPKLYEARRSRNA